MCSSEISTVFLIRENHISLIYDLWMVIFCSRQKILFWRILCGKSINTVFFWNLDPRRHCILESTLLSPLLYGKWKLLMMGFKLILMKAFEAFLSAEVLFSTILFQFQNSSSDGCSLPFHFAPSILLLRFIYIHFNMLHQRNKCWIKRRIYPFETGVVCSFPLVSPLIRTIFVIV